LDVNIGGSSSNNHLAQTWIEQEDVIELLDSDVEMLDVAPLEPIHVEVLEVAPLEPIQVPVQDPVPWSSTPDQARPSAAVSSEPPSAPKIATTPVPVASPRKAKLRRAPSPMKVVASAMPTDVRRAVKRSSETREDKQRGEPTSKTAKSFTAVALRDGCRSQPR
jgi:hypothetical protein